MYTMISSLVLAAVLFVPQDKLSFTYKFTKGETVKYDISTELNSNMKGSDPCFLERGDTVNLTQTGTIELATKEVTEDGTGTVERTFKKFSVTADVLKNKYKYTFAAEKAEKEEKPEEGSPQDHYFQMCRRTTTYAISSAGELTGIPANDGFPVETWLGAKVGMLHWPVKGEGEVKEGRATGAHLTNETWAAPIFHDKVHFTCRNETKKGGAKGMQIKSALGFKEKLSEMEKRPPELQNAELEITVSGEATIDLDPGTGRLHSATLTITMKLRGKGLNAAGEEALIKGEATYKETVTKKD